MYADRLTRKPRILQTAQRCFGRAVLSLLRRCTLCTAERLPVCAFPTSRPESHHDHNRCRHPNTRIRPGGLAANAVPERLASLAANDLRRQHPDQLRAGKRGGSAPRQFPAVASTAEEFNGRPAPPAAPAHMRSRSGTGSATPLLAERVPKPGMRMEWWRPVVLIATVAGSAFWRNGLTRPSTYPPYAPGRTSLVPGDR